MCACACLDIIPVQKKKRERWRKREGRGGNQHCCSRSRLEGEGRELRKFVSHHDHHLDPLHYHRQSLRRLLRRAHVEVRLLLFYYPIFRAIFSFRRSGGVESDEEVDEGVGRAAVDLQPTAQVWPLSRCGVLHYEDEVGQADHFLHDLGRVSVMLNLGYVRTADIVNRLFQLSFHSLCFLYVAHVLPHPLLRIGQVDTARYDFGSNRARPHAHRHALAQHLCDGLDKLHLIFFQLGCTGEGRDGVDHQHTRHNTVIVYADIREVFSIRCEQLLVDEHILHNDRNDQQRAFHLPHVTIRPSIFSQQPLHFTPKEDEVVALAHIWHKHSATRLDGLVHCPLSLLYHTPNEEGMFGRSNRCDCHRVITQLVFAILIKHGEVHARLLQLVPLSFRKFEQQALVESGVERVVHSARGERLAAVRHLHIRIAASVHVLLTAISLQACSVHDR
mmetsp:Transcript_16110/g.40742  ORF Transcript_16110/g.40742 Transcript_16110/m.40742 type:complete len:446 (-) Transcript_16110:536-1873(-)